MLMTTSYNLFPINSLAILDAKALDLDEAANGKNSESLRMEGLSWTGQVSMWVYEPAQQIKLVINKDPLQVNNIIGELRNDKIVVILSLIHI